MSREVREYKIFVSCPSDIKEEKKYIKKEIEDFNRNNSYQNNIIFRYEDWEIGTYSSIGKSAQEEINWQLVDESDMAVAIFWNKVGTRTKNEISGTIEEIERLRKLNKQIFLFFSLRKIEGSILDTDQLDKLRKIKDKYQGTSLYKEYTSLNQFKDLFHTELNLYVQKNREMMEINSRLTKTFSSITISRSSLQEKINQAKKDIFISGASLVSTISTSFVKCVNNEVKVRLLMTKEDENLINECSKLSYANRDELMSHIKTAKKHFYGMEIEDKIKMRCIDAVMPVSLVGIDVKEPYGKIYIQQYLYKQDPAMSPYYVCYFGEKWYETYREQIDKLWTDSEKIDFSNCKQ